MNKIILLGMYLLISSCGKCPECFDISAPIRIIYIDNNGNNLIADDSVKPVKVYLQNSNTEIPFGIKDYVVNNSKEKYHIEFANEMIHERCLNNLCTILIEFEQQSTQDTLIYSIKESKSDCCTTYNVSKFTYNNIDYVGKEENTIGAYEILK